MAKNVISSIHSQQRHAAYSSTRYNFRLGVRTPVSTLAQIQDDLYDLGHYPGLVDGVGRVLGELQEVDAFTT